jgi:hypothetical protein
MIWTLQEVRKQAELVVGLWNGKDSGILEEKAGYALEVLEHLDELENALAQIADMDESDANLK